MIDSIFRSPPKITSVSVEKKSGFFIAIVRYAINDRIQSVQGRGITARLALASADNALYKNKARKLKRKGR